MPLDDEPNAPPESLAGRVDAGPATARLDRLRAIIGEMDAQERALVMALLRERDDAEPPARGPNYRKFGAFAGQFSIGPEFFEPLPEEELRAWGEI